MAIITLELEGNRVRTYSSLGMKIERDGVRYDEAIDPKDKGRVYTETDEPIEGREEMKYSVRSIIREVRELGKYDQFRAFLESAKFDWDFVGSNYLAASDPDFVRMCEGLIAANIITREELDTLLPKCVWTAE